MRTLVVTGSGPEATLICVSLGFCLLDCYFEIFFKLKTSWPESVTDAHFNQ